MVERETHWMLIQDRRIETAGQDLAAQARDEIWSNEEYLAALLQRQVADRDESDGAIPRIRTALFRR